jgi:hypothetical protein
VPAAASRATTRLDPSERAGCQLRRRADHHLHDVAAADVDGFGIAREPVARAAPARGLQAYIAPARVQALRGSVFSLKTPGASRTKTFPTAPTAVAGSACAWARSPVTSRLNAIRV